MKLLDLTLASPAENLACDEALLNSAEAGDGGEILRFWEPQEYFVVVGYANKVETEVNVAACAARKVPIFRRCSGGGTVLQGPGCLNYTLILQIAKNPPLASISWREPVHHGTKSRGDRIRSQKPEAGRRHCRPGPHRFDAGHPSPAQPAPLPGNSPAIPSAASGGSCCFMEPFCWTSISRWSTKLLRMPSRQPDYRNRRGHTDFLTNLNLPAARLKSALGRIWNAAEGLQEVPDREARKLAAEKYSTAGWNFKFIARHLQPFTLRPSLEMTSSLTKWHLNRRFRANAGR